MQTLLREFPEGWDLEMTTEQDFIPDTYRTPVTQSDPPGPAVCFECEHARRYMNDEGHVSTHGDAEETAACFIECALTEVVTDVELCHITGRMAGGGTKRESCSLLNKGGDCKNFVRYRSKKPTPPNAPSPPTPSARPGGANPNPVRLVTDVAYGLGMGVLGSGVLFLLYLNC